ncbi:MAG: thiamine phosphate synthase [Sulfurovum sp.]|nr:thiamine phosphate synthase [Sulfurovaceae bacterium]
MIVYAITDPSTLSFKSIKGDLNRFSTKANMIVYRDKYSQHYRKNAQDFIKEARKYSFQKILLHTDLYLAVTLKADGIHLTSQQFDYIVLAKQLKLFTVVSTHSQKEALKAQELGADMITYSPIFSTPKKGKPIGLKALNNLYKIINIPIIALGGIIPEDNIKECKENGASGFASIRYFK